MGTAFLTCILFVILTISSAELEESENSIEPQNKSSNPEPISVGDVLRDFEQTILDIEKNSTEFADLEILDGLESVENKDGEELEETEESLIRNLSMSNVKYKPKLNCILVNKTDDVEPTVHILNGTELLVRVGEEFDPNVTNRTFPGICSVTMFFTTWCEFSAEAAPFYNALPRFFPGINFYAIDSTNNQNIYAQFGVIALPTVLLFHNSKALYKINNTEQSIDKYLDFVSHFTGFKPLNLSTELTDSEQQGPVPTVAVKQFNYFLLLASLFLVVCGLAELSKSAYFRTLTENLRNAWREAEIQHEHVD